MDAFLLMTAAELITKSHVLIAFAFAVSIVALSYMAGEFFSMPSLKGYSKNELYELGVSAVILILAILLITPNGPFDMVAHGFMLQGVPADRVCSEWEAIHGPYNPVSKTFEKGNVAFGQADYFLGCRPDFTTVITLGVVGVDGVVLRKLTYGYESLMATEMFIGFLQSFSTTIAIPLPVPKMKIDVSIIPFIGMSLINDIHTLIVDLIGTVWAAFAAQKVLLIFIEEAALPVFLPFGLLLRAFPFSRKTGSTIIAVVFAAYFVYPTSILINQQMWEAVANPQQQPGAPACYVIGHTCAIDNDCCSSDCRIGECVSPLTDFSEYKSIYGMCYGKTPAEIQVEIQKEAESYDKAMLDVYFSGTASNDEWTKTSTKLLDFGKLLWHKTLMLYGIVVEPFGEDPGWNLEMMVMPNGRYAMQAAFYQVEMAVLDASMFVMMALLFLVMEIVITLTLMKDFAILIGGEPRVLGLTKLV